MLQPVIGFSKQQRLQGSFPKLAQPLFRILASVKMKFVMLNPKR